MTIDKLIQFWIKFASLANQQFVRRHTISTASRGLHKTTNKMTQDNFRV